MTSRSPCPVATYVLILKSVAATNLVEEAAEPVRRRFNAYYGVRRNAAWRSSFYGRFQAAKGASLTPAALFEDILLGIQSDTGRVEASFASKLVATLRPEAPIIDSVVRGWLAKHCAPPPFGGGIAAAVAYYRWLEGVFGEAVSSPEARDWGDVFANAFLLPPSEDRVSATKQLDFLIWAGADR